MGRVRFSELDIDVRSPMSDVGRDMLIAKPREREREGIREQKGTLPRPKVLGVRRVLSLSKDAAFPF